MATFNVLPRSLTGEKPKSLRKQGMVPMVLIDREHRPVAVKAALTALRAASHGADSHGVIEIQVEGESGVRKAMIKSIDGDSMTRTVLCATLQEVAEGDLVKTDVPVVAIGSVPETESDANVMLTAVTALLHIRAKVSDLPDHIEVDVSKLALGEHISAGEISLPVGVELLSSPEVVLFTVSRVAAPVLTEAETETLADGEVVAEGDAGTGVADGS